MSKCKLLMTGLVLATGFVAAVSRPAAAVIAPPAPIADAARSGLQLVDARSYYHCHNMPRRTRCHGKARLPVNWPPNTNTPGTTKR